MIGQGVAVELISKLNMKCEGKTAKQIEDVENLIVKLPKFIPADLKNVMELINDKLNFFWNLFNDYSEDFYKTKSLSELKEVHHIIFTELKDSYETSFANPDVTKNSFGKDFGEVINSLYTSARGLVSAIRSKNEYSLYRYSLLITEVLNIMNESISMVELEKSVKKIVIEWARDVDEETLEAGVIESYDIDVAGVIDFVKNVDLSDERYMYQYLEAISDNETGVAKFLNSYDEKKLENLARNIVNSYIRSFELDKKDLSIKSTVRIIFNVGQEKLMRLVFDMLKENGLDSFASSVNSTPANKQYHYDHRFGSALFLNEDMLQNQYDGLVKIFDKYQNIFKAYSGPVYLENFGEKTFSPIPKESSLKFSDEQQALSQKYGVKKRSLSDKYVSSDETNFCIVAFPVPEIGEKFEEIYKETIKINMLDSEEYEAMQKNIIDILDKADFVHVKGGNGNKTDVKVKMQKLNNPESETNFNNCGATVNIPVGEVFTSPQLTGTNGVLHVKEVFLNELRYDNIEINFKDGFVDEYTCTNFKDEKENKKYIQENLLFPHKTLPLGEFAIGTNTLAYAMAQKYKILNLLPILIVEKMGPHFAIGDTCYSWSEDFKVYNPIDNKEITARDNEKSILRKEDVQKAYTNCHTDITIPYEELDFIVAVTANGEEFDIIRNGKFNIKGCEKLNEPLV